MVPTGQTGVLVEGWGVRIDRLPADARQGTVALDRPSRIVAVAVCSDRTGDEAEARRGSEAIEAETGLPAGDVCRVGGARLFEAIRAGLEA